MVGFMIFSYVLPQTSLPGIFSFTCFTSSKTLKSFVFLQILEYFLFIFRSQDLQNFWIVVYKLVANPNISVGDVVFPTPPTPWNGLSPGGSTVLWNKNKKQYRVKVSPNIKQYILFEVILNMKIWFWKVYLLHPSLAWITFKLCVFWCKWLFKVVRVCKRWLKVYWCPNLHQDSWAHCLYFPQIMVHNHHCPITFIFIFNMISIQVNFDLVHLFWHIFKVIIIYSNRHENCALGFPRRD